jgi:NAD(P)H-dependent FMN reductase
MKVGIIIGSHKVQSQSAKVGDFVRRRIGAFIAESDVYLLDLGKTPLPLWDESKWQAGGSVKEAFLSVSKELSGCDAFVVISPEWSGMVPAALKNFFLLCDAGELAHKPALIIAVSSGMGGAYPVAELRLSSYKNTFINYIPDHIVIRSVEQLLNGESANPDISGDQYVRDRLDYSIRMLNEYAKALMAVRSSGVIDRKKYPFGM